MPGILTLSELIGRRAIDGTGGRCGPVRDLAVRLTEPYPSVIGVRIGRRGRARVVAWEEVERLDDSALRLRHPSDRVPEAALRGDEIWLARDVLDSQVVDIAGRRLVRVGDVVLDVESESALRLAGVEIGRAAVLRRLGLRRLARRAGSELVDWRDLHLTSARAHEIQLRTSGARVHRLTPGELEAVVARLPAHRAAEVLEAVEPREAEPKPARRARRRRYHRVLKSRRRAPR
jgi:sporulation protein YlmC with PRC-barrel domain